MAVESIGDFEVPPCPVCKESEMGHRCFSHTPKGSQYLRNGWYCLSCKAGPFQLGSMTEAEAAKFAIKLIN